MRLRQRIIKSEKVLSVKSKHDKSKLDPRVSWLIESNEEYKECLKQLWRLSLKAKQNTHQWEFWQEPYQEEAGILMNRMNEILEQHKDKLELKKSRL